MPLCSYWQILEQHLELFGWFITVCSDHGPKLLSCAFLHVFLSMLLRQFMAKPSIWCCWKIGARRKHGHFKYISVIQDTNNPLSLSQRACPKEFLLLSLLSPNNKQSFCSLTAILRQHVTRFWVPASKIKHTITKSSWPTQLYSARYS